jgi:hypothetical protein
MLGALSTNIDAPRIFAMAHGGWLNQTLIELSTVAF